MAKSDRLLDTGFDPKASNTVFSVTVQADGKVLLGGFFTTLQPNGAGAATARNLFARLYNDPISPFDRWKFNELGSFFAPDLGDSDFDGLVQLAEYALNLSPTAPTLPPPAERHLYAEGAELRILG